jgi:hypothetical protein
VGLLHNVGSYSGRPAMADFILIRDEEKSIPAKARTRYCHFLFGFRNKF